MNALQVNGMDNSAGVYAANIQNFVANGGGLLIGGRMFEWSGGSNSVDHPSMKVLLAGNAPSTLGLPCIWALN